MDDISKILEVTPPHFLKERLIELYIAANNSDIADGWDKFDRTSFAETVVSLSRILDKLK